MINEKEKLSYKNPILPEEEQDSAFRHRGGNNWGNETFVHVNHFGTPIHRVNADAYLNDLAGYWSLHEKKLWLIFAFCLLFFAMKLLGS